MFVCGTLKPNQPHAHNGHTESRTSIPANRNSLMWKNIQYKSSTNTIIYCRTHTEEYYTPEM